MQPLCIKQMEAPVRVALVLDHPYTLASSENVPHRRSFSAAVAAAAIRGLEAAGHEVLSLIHI